MTFFHCWTHPTRLYDGSAGLGLLPTFGISKRTGEIIPLPPSTWRIEVGGFSQSLWAIRGDDVAPDMTATLVCRLSLGPILLGHCRRRASLLIRQSFQWMGAGDAYSCDLPPWYEPTRSLVMDAWLRRGIQSPMAAS